ncbi:hypothetical protein [Neobacillus mesonae]|uniref:hypothetical protein n=1 Tax=Neobacillus mesonae TaxID=1193713 RepID=UPI0020425C42|nr:hypothetical protein [Neobacillus mesonae]MCM3566758.1 hypothetical protein [Neobacillus mesonae]
MMNKEEPFREQAERTKQRIDRIVETTDAGGSLPPRSKLHTRKRKRRKWKFKYPLIRILVIFFILLPIIIFSTISYFDGKRVIHVKKSTGSSNYYETIHLDQSNNE